MATFTPSLLTNDAATEAADRTRRGGSYSRGSAGRCKNGSAEILLEPIRDIFPKFADFLCRATLGINFHDGTTVDHRCREVGSMMQRNRRNRSMLRECNGRLVGDLGFRRGCVDDKDEWLARPIAKVDRRADGAQVMRTRPGRNNDQFGDRNNALNGHGDGGRRVDNSKAKTLLPKHFKIGSEARN